MDDPSGYVDSGDFIFMIRPSLKIMLFPVLWPGDPLSGCAEWVHFVLGFRDFSAFFPNIFDVFYDIKKKISRLFFIPLDRKQTCF